MRKIKALLAVVLAVSVVLLSGCANVQALFTQSDSDFYEIKALSVWYIYCSVDINGDNILFLTATGISNYELSIFDVQKNKIVAKTILDNMPLEYIAGAKFDGDDQIIVYDEGNEKAVTFDLSLNQTATVDYEYINDYDSAPESSFLDDTFAYSDAYAYSYEGDCYYFVFYDDPEHIYTFNGKDESIYDVDNRKLFTAQSVYSESNDNWDYKIDVRDLGNALTVNEVDLGTVTQGYYKDITVCALSDQYVCFVERLSNDMTGGSMSTAYIWKYNESAKNEDFSVKALTKDGINDDNARMVSEIESKYGVKIKINKEPQFGYTVELDATPLQVNHVLTQLSACFALCPENFIKEIYKDAEYVKGLNIHIVEWIDGADAFANDFSEYYEICFSCRGFSRSVIFHELMHLIDNRIQTYYDDNNMDFYDEWWKLNPSEDFEYFYDEDHDINEEYFVSHYAMTNVAEDLASTFQAMFESYDYGEDDRFTKYEHVGKKAALICEALRKSFPSVQNADEVCWEKYTKTSK